MKRIGIAMALGLALASGNSNAAVVFNDGDFSTWSFGSFATGGSATMSREATGGNPGARLNVTTVTASLAESAFGTGIKTDYSTTAALAGTGFTLTLDVLSGAGAFGQGQGLNLLVEQGGSVYALALGITNVQAAFTTLAFSGTLNAASFTLVAGGGPAQPDFSGGTTTRFGFAAGNTNSATLTQYYDNVRLDLAAVVAQGPGVPIPLMSSIGLLALIATLGVAGLARVRRR